MHITDTCLATIIPLKPMSTLLALLLLLLQSALALNPKPLLESAQIRAWERDGYIVVRGLFSEMELDELTKASDALIRNRNSNDGNFFSVIEKNLLYGSIKNDPKQSQNKPSESQNAEDTMNIDQAVEVFRRVALHSKLPQVCAEVMQLDPNTQCLRILRDVFLAKAVSTTSTCDWHCDDIGFWPESFISSATIESGKDQRGINAWLALDDYKSDFGGSMIVSKGSHNAPWKEEAYKSIGQDRSLDGGKSKEELAKAFLQAMDPKNVIDTCSLHISNPKIRAKAEAARVDYDLKKGDVVLATRLLFHRTAKVSEAGIRFYEALKKNLLCRYSIRYVPGSARLPQGELLELSALSNPDYIGKSLNEICLKRKEWYPMCWPIVDSGLRLDELGANEVVEAKIIEARKYKELQDLMNEMQRIKAQQ